MEHALDMTWAERCGLHLDQVALSQPDTGEQAIEIARKWIMSKAIDLVIIDSVAALVPRAEIEGEVEDQNIALQARLMSKAMRLLAGPVGASGTALVFTNQIRTDIMAWGNPETTPGGKALKFYASIRIVLRSPNSLKIEMGGVRIGRRVRAEILKNKVAILDNLFH